ncbi:DUF6328 family protein [Actinocorallia populi]|uniref:DUF6328 family protein n=1 Tax=Actinocorallia populi TaxID=2079200 RepID=UPI001E5342D4|nr:DUF6328 family protein [Actinocorallia populi]
MEEPPGMDGSPSGVPGESPAARADRNFVELLQGLRVAVTGVQVLFAFLLTVPFSPGFEEVTDAQRTMYYVALVSAAIASIFFIAPAAQHRILFRQGLKEPLVHRSNRYAMLGTLALAVSITSATLLVVDYIFRWDLALASAIALAGMALWMWFLGPMLYRSRKG